MISIHCHNDYGLAVANSLAGVLAGADQAHLTINGIGERSGNTSLEEFVMGCFNLYGWRTNIDYSLLYETSRMVVTPHRGRDPAQQGNQSATTPSGTSRASTPTGY